MNLNLTSILGHLFDIYLVYLLSFFKQCLRIFIFLRFCFQNSCCSLVARAGQYSRSATLVWNCYAIVVTTVVIICLLLILLYICLEKQRSEEFYISIYIEFNRDNCRSLLCMIKQTVTNDRLCISPSHGKILTLCIIGFWVSCFFSFLTTVVSSSLLSAQKLRREKPFIRDINNVTYMTDITYDTLAQSNPSNRSTTSVNSARLNR